MRRLLPLQLPVLLLIAACGDDPTGGGTAIARIELAPEAATLEAIGEIVPIQARIFRQDGTLVTNAEVVWSSSDTRVAIVDKSGLVRAAGDGQAAIGAAFGGISASTTVKVLQRIDGFGFGAGPSDAVNGGSSGDVTVAVLDPLGAAVARASGTVTLRILPGSPGDLVGGPRTATLGSGVAVFGDVRVSGEGEGYRLEASWQTRTATSNPFSVVAGPDLVALINSAGGEHGFLVDGFASGTFANDHGVVGAGDTVAIGIFRSMPGSNDEILAFGPGRRPAMLRPVPWTAGIDTVSVAFDDPIALNLTVWIVKGPFDTQSARARASVDTTRNIWSDQYAGLVFDSVEVINATGDPDAAGLFDVTLCESQSGLENRIGKRPGRINAYWVGTVDGGTDRGRACPIGGDHVVMAERSGHELLSHEIGHLLSLTHIDAFTDFFDQSNVMHSASNRRHYLTEGQVFRQQFDTNSAINRLFGLRSAEARHCPTGTVSALCPAVESRLWSDGHFPPNAGATRAAPATAATATLSVGPRAVVERWLEIDCEMDQNEGLGTRMRGLGDDAVRELRAAFLDGPPAGADADQWRRAALDGLAFMGTPAAGDALAAFAASAGGAWRAEIEARLLRIGR